MAITRNDDVTPLKMKREHAMGPGRRRIGADMVQQWKQKPLHGKYPTLVEDPHIDKQATFGHDVAVPLPHNLATKHNEKISKYIPLADEIKKLWHQQKVTIIPIVIGTTPLADEIKKLWHQQKVTIIPIVIGTTGEIPHTVYEGLETLGLKRDLYLQFQKAVLLSTCSIVRRVLGEDDDIPLQ
ncbi:hypothetical protein QE152_g7266 [Popillia japonica]|uniref:Uncharacterized protein n=1 Tax=Popillia japonica TaxID=7064 RepID=A0AAW1MBY5_POPJA